MVSPGLGFRIEGIEDAQGALREMGPRTLDRLQKKAKTRADKTAERFNREIRGEYTSQWATGRLANVRAHVQTDGDGVTVDFSIPNVRELEFVTAILPDSYFTEFPVEPFEIVPVEAKYLRIPLPAGGRLFTRGAGGRFTGSRAGDAAYTKLARWGSKTGGFRRDVIGEVAQAEGEEFIADMEEAVRGVIVELTEGE